MPADAKALARRLRRLFLEELEENLGILTGGLLALEQAGRSEAGPGSDQLNELFRSAHNLKGAAYSAGVTDAATICHRMESVFAELRSGERPLDAEALEPLYADLEALKQVAGALRDDERQEPRGVESKVAGAGPARAETPPAGRHFSPPTSIRVAVDKLDTLVNEAGAALTVAGAIEAVVGHAKDAEAGVKELAKRLSTSRVSPSAGDQRGGPALGHALDVALDTTDRLVEAAVILERQFQESASKLAQAAQRLRLQPFSEVCEGLDLTTRDAAVRSGKEVRLEIVDSDIEIDRGVAAALREPLVHLVRNAVDHGIEPPSERAASAKPPHGTVRVRPSIDDGRLRVTVSDDGGGVDLAALKAAGDRVGARGSDDLALAFAPGVSTASAVTEVSGRGVGLDAVRTAIEGLGGTVELWSSPGVGTEVTITAPVSLATAHLLLVDIGHGLVGLPLAGVRRLVHVPASEVQEIDGTSVVRIEEQIVKLASLARILGLEPGPPPALDERLRLVWLAGTNTAVVVDEVLGEVQAVTQSLPVRVEGLPGVVGCAVLRDATVSLVLNPSALARLATGETGIEAPLPPKKPRRVLLAEDTMTTRVLERSILEDAGYAVTVAMDGEDAWRGLQEEEVDAVVTDVHMPKMDGFALCQAIRSSTRHRDLPVVLVTSLSADEDRRRGAEVGASAYIVKSAFDQELLLETLERLL